MGTDWLLVATLLNVVGVTATDPMETGPEVCAAGAAGISRPQSVLAEGMSSCYHGGRHHNLRDRLECEINVGSRQFMVSARKTAADGVDTARLREIVSKNNANRPALRLRLAKFKEAVTLMHPCSR